METRDFLLKLHYLGLEIDEIYRIANCYRRCGYQPNDVKTCLSHHHARFVALDMKRIQEDLHKNQICYTTFLDDHYPEQLRNIFMPPLVLFYQGNLDLVRHKSMAVIGTRENSA